MEFENRLKALETFYVGVLADTVKWYTREGILERVTEAKRKEQLLLGGQTAKQLSITKPEEIFTKLSDIFNCTKWEINPETYGFTAEAKECKLCALSKRLATGSPCNIFCLYPMEGMLKGLDSNYQFNVKETLWDGVKCRVAVVK